MNIVDLGYRRVARPVLFRLGGRDAEAAHQRTLDALATLAQHPIALRSVQRLLGAQTAPVSVFDLRFPSPVGLAAGVDKDGLALTAWPALGLGFVEAGTVTAVAQQGNPRPRLFRLPASGAAINRMGFPNHSAAALADRIRRTGPIGVPVGISLGKSKVTALADAVPDYLTSLRAVHDQADYIAVNVSSPNTPGLRGLQDRGALDELITALIAESRALAQPHRRGGQPVPLLVKIAPDLSADAIADVLQVCADRSVAGVIAVNTTVERPAIAPADRGLGMETGGLSGRPLRERALEVVRFVCTHTDLPVIGVGGISCPDDGLAMLEAGASLVQIYTGLLYAGPGLVRDITRRAANSDTVESRAADSDTARDGLTHE